MKNPKEATSVDGRNPANQLRLVVFLIIYRFFLHPKWCAGFLKHQPFHFSVGQGIFKIIRKWLPNWPNLKAFLLNKFQRWAGPFSREGHGENVRMAENEGVTWGNFTLLIGAKKNTPFIYN